VKFYGQNRFQVISCFISLTATVFTKEYNTLTIAYISESKVERWVHVPSRHLPGACEETKKRVSWNSRCTGWDPNRVPRERISKTATVRPTHSILFLTTVTVFGFFPPKSAAALWFNNGKHVNVPLQRCFITNQYQRFLRDNPSLGRIETWIRPAENLWHA
jgi:hypothetical protein